MPASILYNSSNSNEYYKNHPKQHEYIVIESTPIPSPTEKTPLLFNTDTFNECKSSDIEISTITSRYSSTINLNNKYKKNVCNLNLFILTILIFSGLFIATYLLTIIDKIPKINFALDLVNREVWSKISMPLERILNSSSILNVLILHTGGEECSDIQDCTELLRNFQALAKLQSNSEIPYNFLIGGNGQTYEIRGWDYENGFQTLPKKSLVIGFIDKVDKYKLLCTIGNFTNKSPTGAQLDSALSLIIESKRKKKLNNNYLIYGVRNITISHLDGQELFNIISQWDRFDTLLKVL